MRTVAFLTLLTVAPLSVADNSQPPITNYQTQGNLAAATKPACFSIIQATNKLTPADLYGDVGACLEKDDYADATDLFALAGVYGWFDMKRVADETAHDALAVLKMNTFDDLSDEKKNKFLDIMKKRFDVGSKDLGQLCETIKTIGMPDYYPAYMIQHGMGAVMSSMSGRPSADDGLAKGFDAKSTWVGALDGYLHCPGS